VKKKEKLAPTMKNAIEVVKEVCKIKHPNAHAIFWAGSVAKNKGTTARSDLDLVIVYDQLPNAYREAFIYNNWPIDTFVNDEKRLRNFFEINRKNGTSGLLSMVAEGIEVPQSTEFSYMLKQLAIEMLKQGPVPWTIDEINSARFFITDLLDDIIEPHTSAEQFSSVIYLYGLLAKFYLRSNNQWAGDGKYVTRKLEEFNPKMAGSFYDSFESFFKTKDTRKIAALVDDMLAPLGGRHWDGFYLKASN